MLQQHIKIQKVLAYKINLQNMQTKANCAPGTDHQEVLTTKKVDCFLIL